MHGLAAGRTLRVGEGYRRGRTLCVGRAIAGGGRFASRGAIAGAERLRTGRFVSTGYREKGASSTGPEKMHSPSVENAFLLQTQMGPRVRKATKKQGPN